LVKNQNAIAILDLNSTFNEELQNTKYTKTEIGNRFEEALVNQLSNTIDKVAIRLSINNFVHVDTTSNTFAKNVCKVLAKSKNLDKWNRFYNALKPNAYDTDAEKKNKTIALHNILCEIVKIQSEYLFGSETSNFALKKEYLYWIKPIHFENIMAEEYVHSLFDDNNTPFFFKSTESFFDFYSAKKEKKWAGVIQKWIILQNNIRCFYSMTQNSVYNNQWLKVWITNFGNLTDQDTITNINMIYPFHAFFIDEYKQNEFASFASKMPKFLFLREIKIEAEMEITEKQTIADYVLPSLFDLFDFIDGLKKPQTPTDEVSILISQLISVVVSYAIVQDTVKDQLYYKNLEKIYDHKWFNMLGWSETEHIEYFNKLFQIFFIKLSFVFPGESTQKQNATEKENAIILQKANTILAIVSIHLKVTSTKSNKFYDMIADMLVDLKAQKQIDLKLVVNAIPDDNDHILVQLAPRRKKWLGIFAKQQPIDYAISGTQRSFLVMHYFFPTGKKSTSPNAVPDQVSLEFMDLQNPSSNGSAEIYSVDLMDRIEFPGKPNYSPDKLRRMWLTVVDSFKRIDLKPDGQDVNNKIIIFKMDPRKPRTIAQLRKQLQLVYYPLNIIYQSR
jgi:hypothetical protein